MPDSWDDASDGEAQGGGDYDALYGGRDVPLPDAHLSTGDRAALGAPRGRDLACQAARPFSKLTMSRAASSACALDAPCEALADGAEGAAVAITQDASAVAVGTRSGQVQVYANSARAASLGQPVCALSLRAEGGGLAACTAVRFRPNSAACAAKDMLLVARGTRLLHVHWGSNSVARVTQEEADVLNVVCRADGEMFATASADGAVRVYDEQRAAPLLRLTEGDGVDTAGHTGRVFGLAWAAEDHQTVLSAGWDGRALVWDLRQGRAVRAIHGVHVAGDGLDVQAGLVLTGSCRAWAAGAASPAALQTWDLGSGRLLADWPLYQCQATAARFLMGSGMVVAGGAGVAPAAHACRLFSQDGELLGSLACGRPVVGIAAAADGTVAVLAAGRQADDAPLLPGAASQLHVLPQQPGGRLPAYPLLEPHALAGVAGRAAKDLGSDFAAARASPVRQQNA